MTTPLWLQEDEARVPAAVRQLVQGQLASTERVFHAVTGAVLSTGEVIHRLKIFDTATQETRALIVDGGGAAIQYDQLVKKEEQKAFAATGVVEPSFHAKVSAAPGVTHRAQIIYRASGLPLRPAVHTPAADQAYRAAINQAVKTPGDVLEQRLAALGTVISRTAYAPFIVVDLPSSTILTSLKSDPAILAISDGAIVVPEKGAAQSTTDLGLYQAFYQYGYYGLYDTRVGITGEWEDGSCGIGNPYFRFVATIYSSPPATCTNDAQCTHCGGLGRCTNGICTLFHGTMVAGMIGHQAEGSPGFRGIPYAKLYFVSSGQTHWDSLDWLFDNGVTVENES